MARTKSRKSNLDNHCECGLRNLTVAFNMIVAARVESPFRDDLRGEDLLSFGTTLIRRCGLTQSGNLICGHLLNDDAMVSFFVFIFELLTLQAYIFFPSSWYYLSTDWFGDLVSVCLTFLQRADGKYICSVRRPSSSIQQIICSKQSPINLPEPQACLSR